MVKNIKSFREIFSNKTKHDQEGSWPVGGGGGRVMAVVGGWWFPFPWRALFLPRAPGTRPAGRRRAPAWPHRACNPCRRTVAACVPSPFPRFTWMHARHARKKGQVGGAQLLHVRALLEFVYTARRDDGSCTFVDSYCWMDSVRVRGNVHP